MTTPINGTPAVDEPASTVPGFLSDNVALTCRVGVRVEPGDRTGEVRLTSALGGIAVGNTTEALRGALDRLGAGPVRLSDFLASLTDQERRQLFRVLDRVRILLTWSLLDGERTLASVEPTARHADYVAATVAATTPLRLSKFALVRSRNNQTVLESPLAKHRVTLLDPAAASVVAELGAATSIEELVGRGISVPALTDLMGHLVGAGFVEAQRDGSFGSDTDPVLRQWDFHDLLFHSRTRIGRSDEPFGGVFPYVDVIDPQPAVKTPPAGPVVELYRPSWEEIADTDPGLLAVQEGRTSIRHYGDDPLTVRQLGEFLYRVGRVRARFGPGDRVPYEVAARPYPCGGGAYELEIYLTVRSCAGLGQGIYYYDPVAHALVLINTDTTDREAMLYTASTATGGQAHPTVLITLTSRFQRLSWKYRSIAYAVTLRHAGVLYQTMYLVATAMGLAPCGLGSGDADLAARAFGLDYLRESSVGDFLLGSKPVLDESPRIPANWQAVNDPGWILNARSQLPNGR